MQVNSKSNKILIVYFSRTDTTRKAAHAIARVAGADLVEVKAGRYPRGLRGYFRAGLDATLGRPVPIEAREVDISKYGLVVVGTPVWNSAVSAPIRAYLMKHGSQMHQVAFFITHGGSGANRAFRQMQEISHKFPVASLDLRTTEIRRGLHHPTVEARIKEFMQALREREPARRRVA